MAAQTRRKRVPEFQVIIPYKTLMSLLNAAETVDELDKRLRHLDDKLEALRRIQGETIEKIAQVERDL
ncbi:MAG: hypothetical protein IJZ38_03175 [Bacteroides sp.]|nr:hypothetical protein [Bacteroides sp.]